VAIFYNNRYQKLLAVVCSKISIEEKTNSIHSKLLGQRSWSKCFYLQ